MSRLQRMYRSGRNIHRQPSGEADLLALVPGNLGGAAVGHSDFSFD